MTWSEADLVRRLRGALELAEQAVRLLAADGYTDPDNPSYQIRGEKVVGETGLLLLAAAPCASRVGICEELEAVASLLVPYAQGERVRARICMEPSLALEHALAHICLSRIGFPDLELDRLLVMSLEAESSAGRERPPHRELEQEWLMRVWGRLPEGRHVNAHLPKQSALGRPIDLLSLHKDEAYAFTHSLMYLTDLGTRRVRLPRPQSTIVAEADAACASSLDEPDYDLCAEVLLTWPYLRRRWSSSATLGFAVLASVEDTLGFLPAPGVSLERLATLRGDERSHYVITSSYHSAYVMGLLCAAALHGGCLIRSSALSRNRYRGAAADFLALVGSGDPEPAWRAYFDELSSNEQDVASPFLLNVCLRRGALRRELETVRSALLIGERYGLLDAPAPRQAAELLRRSVMFATLPSLVAVGTT